MLTADEAEVELINAEIYATLPGAAEDYIAQMQKERAVKILELYQSVRTCKQIVSLMELPSRRRRCVTCLDYRQFIAILSFLAFIILVMFLLIKIALEQKII